MPQGLSALAAATSTIATVHLHPQSLIVCALLPPPTLFSMASLHAAIPLMAPAAVQAQAPAPAPAPALGALAVESPTVAAPVFQPSSSFARTPAKISAGDPYKTRGFAPAASLALLAATRPGTESR